MVRLNPEQAKLRDRIEAAKKKYDADLALIDAAYVKAKEDAKQPIRELVGQARDSGMPVRQIHLAAGFAQVSSLQSFLLPSLRAGGSLLYTGDARHTDNPIVAAQQQAAQTMTVRPEPGMVRWTRADGTEMSIERRDTMYFYYIPQAYVDKLTPEEYEWFKNDAKTLMGKAEYEEWQRTADEPERWATQRDNPHIRRV